LYLYKQHLFL